MFKCFADAMRSAAESPEVDGFMFIEFLRPDLRAVPSAEEEPRGPNHVVRYKLLVARSNVFLVSGAFVMIEARQRRARLRSLSRT